MIIEDLENEIADIFALGANIQRSDLERAHKLALEVNKRMKQNRVPVCVNIGIEADFPVSYIRTYYFIDWSSRCGRYVDYYENRRCKLGYYRFEGDENYYIAGNKLFERLVRDESKPRGFAVSEGVNILAYVNAYKLDVDRIMGYE